MTREEAIEYLEKLYMKADITDEYGDMDDTEPYETALNMAIEALERIDSYEDSRHTALEQEYLKGYEQGKKRQKGEWIVTA